MLDVFCMLLFLYVITHNKHGHDSHPLTFLVIFYLGYLFVIAFNLASNYWTASLWIYFRIYLLRYLFFFIALRLMNEKDITINYLKVVFWIIFLAALYALWQRYMGIPYWDMKAYWGPGGRTTNLLQSYSGSMQYFYRIISTFSDATTSGYFISIGVLIGVVMSLMLDDKTRWIYLAATIVCIYAVFLSSSRAAYLFCFIGLCIISLFRKPFYLLILFVSFFACIALANYYPESFYSKYFLSLFSIEEDPSYLVRLENRQQMRELLTTFFGFGHGSAGTFGKSFLTMIGVGEIRTIPFPSDSLFILLLYEQGMIGFALFSIILITAICLGVRNYVYAKFRNMKYIMLLCIAVLIASIPFWYVQNSFFLYFHCSILAIIINFSTIQKKMLIECTQHSG